MPYEAHEYKFIYALKLSMTLTLTHPFQEHTGSKMRGSSADLCGTMKLVSRALNTSPPIRETRTVVPGTDEGCTQDQPEHVCMI